MARPAKLSDIQCHQARLFRSQHMPVSKIAEKFDVSESTVYKVLDGSYTPKQTMPQGVTPSLFFQESAFEDDLMLAAARLIIAKAATQARH